MNCETCLKPRFLCLCDLIQPLKTRLKVLILQHPQEPDHELGSARIAHLALSDSELRIGLSWRNLQAALNQPAIPSHWAVLYLGSGVKGEKKGHNFPTHPISPLQVVNQKGVPQPFSSSNLEGFVVLDGTWSQAKTLWWRNPWLLKLKRMILTPTQPSLYGKLRREPRKECLSTLESIAETLDQLGEPKETGVALRSLFSELLKRQKTSLKLK